MQQQQGGDDSGLFAVAFAVDFDKDLFSFHYNQAKCFRENQLVHFPHEARTKRRRVLSVHEVPNNTSNISSGRTLNGQYSFTVVCMIFICCNMTFMH